MLFADRIQKKQSHNNASANAICILSSTCGTVWHHIIYCIAKSQPLSNNASLLSRSAVVVEFSFVRGGTAAHVQNKKHRQADRNQTERTTNYTPSIASIEYWRYRSVYWVSPIIIHIINTW